MAIYKGDKEIVGLYKGPTEIIKRYKGSNLIYNVFKWLPYSYEHIYNSLVPQYINKSKIPEEYQEVEYIESTGTQYINSTLIPSATHKFSIRFSVGYLGNCVAFGSRTSGNYDSSLNQIYLNVTNNNEIKLFNIFGTNDLVLNNSVEANTVFTYKNIQNNNCQLSSPTQPYYIFTLNNMGSPSTIANIKMYYFKIYDNNTLVRDFIPCYRKSDNVIGLYDKVNNTFYTNAGTGTFLKGADVKRAVKDKAQVNVIYGNSVVENQLCIIPTISSQTTNGVTLTNNGDGSITLNGTATATFDFTLMGNLDRDIPFAHKVLITNFKKPSTSTYFLYDAYESNLASLPDTPGAYIKDKQGSSTIISPRIRIESGATINETIFIMYIDLTQWFPFNTPTTLADTRVQAIINRGYIPYNTGELKSVDIGEISSEPYNLFDEEFVNKGIQSDGTPFDGGNNLSSKNPIEVHGEKSYTFEVDYENSNAVFTNTFSHSIKFYSGLPISSSTFISNHSFSLDKTTKGKASKNVEAPSNAKYAMIHCYYLTNPTEVIGQTWCFHLTGTRTGYAPHTQSYTLPFIYQGNSALNAHDTLEITNTEYVFTKNITEDNLSNYAFYYADSTKFLYTTRELNGCRTDSIWSPNALTNISGYKLVDSNKLSDNDVACTIYAGKFYIRNDALTEQQLKDVIANKTIKYQLANPQVIRIPKKHLAVVDLGTLNWSYDSYNTAFYADLSNVVLCTYGQNSPIPNIVCSKYTTMNTYYLRQSNDKIVSTNNTASTPRVFIKDTSYSGDSTGAEQLKSDLSGIYLFYETEDEVDDILFDINIEAGGSVTTNWFSWVENQLAVLTRESSTLRGITLTKNGDNDLSVSGTSQKDENFVIGTFNNISGHKYFARTIFLSGKPTELSGYWIKWKTVNYGQDIGDGIIFTGTATENSYIIFTIDNANITVDCRFRLQLIDLTLGFGEGKEPTSIDDPRIQYIIKQGYIPTNTTGTNKSISSEVLPNIDFKIKCK